MGKYFKVYLTDLEEQGLEALQEKREKVGGNGAANALFKEGLRSLCVREGVMEYAPAIGDNAPTLRRVKVEEQSSSSAPRRRSRRAGNL